MDYRRFPLVSVLGIALTFLLSIVSVGAQTQSTALERGYRTGYSDGYNAGFRDRSDKAPRDYKNNPEYQKADRTYNDVWGPIEDYRDGYQQGFEVGYPAGYDNQQFDSTLPTGLRRRPTSDATSSAPAPANTPQTSDQTNQNQPSDTTNNVPVNTTVSGSTTIPKGTVLTLELVTPLSSETTQRGDHFEARVTAPNEFAGSVVEGRISDVKRAGKTKGVSRLQLTFETIRSNDNRSSALHADLVEIVPMSREEVKVDAEGGVRGPDSTKDDVAKVGAASGIGAIIGLIAGGAKGAAIGAVVGGGAGTAGVMTQRGKDIHLERGQQLKVRTSVDTGL